MKLFRRRPKPPKQADETPVREPALSMEQKSLLEKPIDPQEADRLLQKICASKAKAERAVKAQRIVDFPHDGSGERHLIQDERGFWRVVPGPSPERGELLLDSL